MFFCKVRFTILQAHCDLLLAGCLKAFVVSALKYDSKTSRKKAWGREEEDHEKYSNSPRLCIGVRDSAAEAMEVYSE